MDIEEEAIINIDEQVVLYEGTYVIQVKPNMKANIIMESVDDSSHNRPGSETSDTN